MTRRKHQSERHHLAHTPPSRYLDSEPVILGSARTHGITDDDMMHAWRNTLWSTGPQDDGLAMMVGPDRVGNLLELGVVESRDLPGVILLVHAMPARQQFLKRR